MKREVARVPKLSERRGGRRTFFGDPACHCTCRASRWRRKPGSSSDDGNRRPKLARMFEESSSLEEKIEEQRKDEATITGNNVKKAVTRNFKSAFPKANAVVFYTTIQISNSKIQTPRTITMILHANPRTSWTKKERTETFSKP
jgi:hypothetical protein